MQTRPPLQSAGELDGEGVSLALSRCASRVRVDARLLLETVGFHDIVSFQCSWSAAVLFGHVSRGAAQTVGFAACLRTPSLPGLVGQRRGGPPRGYGRARTLREHQQLRLGRRSNSPASRKRLQCACPDAKCPQRNAAKGAAYAPFKTRPTQNTLTRQALQCSSRPHSHVRACHSVAPRETLSVKGMQGWQRVGAMEDGYAPNEMHPDIEVGDV